MRLNPALQQPKEIIIIFLQNRFQIILGKLWQCHPRLLNNSMKDLIVPLLRHVVAWSLFHPKLFLWFIKMFPGGKDLDHLLNFMDLPCYKALDAQLDLWEIYWLNNTNCHPDYISSTLKSINFSTFNNIKIYLRILVTLPVTTCTCKRSFSSMRRLKNYTPSTMVSG